MYKIFNPKTKRYINSGSNLGKSILQNSYNINKSNICPINNKFLNICDKGLISKDLINPLLLELQNLLGEFCDLYSVIHNTKKLCSFDFSIYSKNKYKLSDKLLINNLIDFANTKDIHYIHNTKTGGIYLKTIFFHKNNLDSALKLMKIIWFPCTNIKTNIDYQIALGYLLGYTHENIIYFIKTRYNTIINSKYLLNIINCVDDMNVQLKDLQTIYKII
jgi:hypothetical protein